MRALSRDSEETAPLTGEAPASSTQASPLDNGVNPEVEVQPIALEFAELSWQQRVQSFAFEYGPIGICTHLVLSFVWFAAIYAGVSSGIAVTAILKSVGFPTSPTSNSAGSFLLAYAVYKILTPVRWLITLAVMPAVVHARRRARNLHAALSSVPLSPSSERFPSLA